MKKKFLPVLCVFLLAVPLFAQEGEDAPPSYSGDFWFGLGAEAALYSREGGAFGGSFALGYGKGASIGLKAGYLVDLAGIGTLELNFLLRVYLRGATANAGPFLQLSGGPALFTKDGSLEFPSELGIITAGLSFGWRFLLGRYFFVEPGIRAGYPYIVGAGVSGGMRF